MSTTSWQIGDVRITRVVELTAERQPEFGYRNLTTEEILGQDWLKPHFATEDGKLISAIQAFVVESRGKRIIVDTCVGNDKERAVPAWNKLQTAYLNHLEQADLQLAREPYPLPTMTLNPDAKDIFSFDYDDFELTGYRFHPHIPAKVAV